MSAMYKKAAQEFVEDSDLIVKMAALDIIESIKQSLKDYAADVKGNFQELVRSPREFLNRTYSGDNSYRNLREQYNAKLTGAVSDRTDLSDLRDSFQWNPSQSWATEKNK